MHLKDSFYVYEVQSIQIVTKNAPTNYKYDSGGIGIHIIEL